MDLPQNHMHIHHSCSLFQAENKADNVNHEDRKFITQKNQEQRHKEPQNKTKNTAN